MRVCLRCNRVGPAVENCDIPKTINNGRCAIVDRGWRAEPPGDYLPMRATEGALIEGVEVTSTFAVLPGDAVMNESPRALPSSPPAVGLGALLAECEVALRTRPAATNVVTSPDGNPKTAVGITKPSLHAIPPVALLHLGQAMADGNRKYGLVNWRHDPITMSVYINAIWRHMLALWDGQNADPATGIKHLAYIMANCAILLDAEAQGTLTDDRSTLPGKTAELIERMTKQKETP